MLSVHIQRDDEDFVRSELVAGLENGSNIKCDLYRQLFGTIASNNNDFVEKCPSKTVRNRPELRAAHIYCIRIIFVIVCDDDDFNDRDLL